MTEITVAYKCPLGETCQEVVDGMIVKCYWLVGIEGKDPQGNTTIKEEKCIFVWLPRLLIENTQVTRGHQQALESMRNAAASGSDFLGGLLNLANVKERLVHAPQKQEDEAG